MKIVITGSTGFIGRYLLQRLSIENNDIVCISSKNYQKDFEALQQSTDCSYLVYHLAGKLGNQDSWIDPHSFFVANVVYTEAVLEFCRATNSTMVFTSSFLYQPENSDRPMSEFSRINPSTPYLQSKFLAELLCQSYSSQFSVNVTVLRLFNVYGAGQSKSFVIPHIINQVEDSSTINIKNLDHSRDFVFIYDVVEALLRAGNRKESYRVFNIGTGISSTVQELIAIVGKVWGKQLVVYSEDSMDDSHIYCTRADITRAKNELHWEPMYSLEQGIQEIKNKSSGENW